MEGGVEGVDEGVDDGNGEGGSEGDFTADRSRCLGRFCRNISQNTPIENIVAGKR